MIYFVTGGSRGIGAGIVLHAVKEGNDVAFTYVNSEERAQKIVEQAKDINPDVKCKAYRMDVRSADSVESACDDMLMDFDSVDVIVNNAGANRDNLLVSMSNEEWDDVIATNLTGPFYVCRHFLTTLLAQRFGRIINISSISAVGSSGQCNYSAAKAGLHGFTQSIAKEYGRKGINANVLAPGYFATEMTKDLPEDLQNFWRSYCPMPKGRTGEMIEIAGAVSFLASPAGGFINGQIININGGLDWGP
ncbi:MAG: SDR family oxidoreductase [Deltaproteobacteria bacterium]|nr:MAG: SDR family oxidoreductase [Deltaproteobacteria bacterium]